MKKEYIVELTEAEADGIMDEHWIGELVRCNDCKHRDPEDHKCDCGHDIQWQLPRADDWFCADGKRR